MITQLMKSVATIITCIYLTIYMLLFTILYLLGVEMPVELQLYWTQRAIVALSILVLQNRERN